MTGTEGDLLRQATQAMMARYDGKKHMFPWSFGRAAVHAAAVSNILVELHEMRAIAQLHFFLAADLLEGRSGAGSAHHFEVFTLTSPPSPTCSNVKVDEGSRQQSGLSKRHSLTGATRSGQKTANGALFQFAPKKEKTLSVGHLLLSLRPESSGAPNHDFFLPSLHNIAATTFLSWLLLIKYFAEVTMTPMTISTPTPPAPVSQHHSLIPQTSDCQA